MCGCVDDGREDPAPFAGVADVCGGDACWGIAGDELVARAAYGDRCAPFMLDALTFIALDTA